MDVIFVFFFSLDSMLFVLREKNVFVFSVLVYFHFIFRVLRNFINCSYPSFSLLEEKCVHLGKSSPPHDFH